MFRYAVVFGLLGFVISAVMGLMAETDLTEVLLRSMFWGICFGVAGGLIGLAAGRVVAEIDLPSDQEEADAHRYERRMREYLTTAEVRRKGASSDKEVREEETDDDKADTQGQGVPVPSQPNAEGS